MFTVQKSKNNNLRKGILKVKRGELLTPFFMPDATRGFVKLTDNEEIGKAMVDPMVVNTFHLYLQPGLKTIKKAGGINFFMHYDRPLLSDSGGYQVFSLIHRSKEMGKIYEDKVVFKSPIDGSKHELTPEKSIQIQFDLGVDMMVCLDDCPPNEFSKKDLEKSVQRTIAWAKRCKNEYEKQIKKRKLTGKNKPLLFGVIQGGKYPELRQKCASELVKLNFDGYGFGARPIDEKGTFLADILQYTADLIPPDKLRFALGIGTPQDIVLCSKMGWDMFDCVIPTREGRHGRLFYFTKDITGEMANKKIKKVGKFYKTININNAKFSNDFSPINKDSKISLLKTHSKAYLHYLFKQKEPLAYKLASLNNLEFYTELMVKIRQ